MISEAVLQPPGWKGRITRWSSGRFSAAKAALLGSLAGCAAVALVLPASATSASGPLTIGVEFGLLGLAIVLGVWLLGTQPLQRPFSPLNLFLVLFVLYFLVKPIDGLLLGHAILDRYRVSATSGPLVGGSIALSVLSVACVFAGYALIRPVGGASPSAAGRPPATPWSDRAIYAVVGLAVLINLIAVAVFVQEVGGVGSYFGSLANGLLLVQGKTHLFPLVATYASAALIIFTVHRYGRLPWIATAALAVVAIVLLQFDPNLTRQNVLTLAIALVLVYLALRASGPTFGVREWAVIGGLAVVLLGYSLGHELFRETSGTGYATPTNLSGYVHRLFEPFKPSENVAVLLSLFPSHYPLDYGRHYLDGFEWGIPRTFWPAKPDNFGYEWVSFRPLRTSGYQTSFTYIGELYVAAGTVGVAAGSLVLGAILGLFRHLEQVATRHRYLLLIYVVLLSAWLPNLIRAGFYAATITLVAYIPPVLVAGLVLHRAAERRRVAMVAAGGLAAYLVGATLVLGGMALGAV